jgi:tRNA(Ile2)-agmatinylcytidine synthase
LIKVSLTSPKSSFRFILRYRFKQTLIYNNIGSEIIWIGIDDTDSVTGGCTTYLACALIKKLTDENYDIIGYPRLVRLNPNIPWKTRGNGAISIQVGKGNDEKTKIGEIENKEVFCYQNNSFEDYDDVKIKKIVEQTVDKYARLEDENTNSGFVLLKKQPSFKTYENAVRGIVFLEEIEKLLKSSNAHFKGYKNNRGLIGATASVAWSSKNDRTYELITYRKEEKWGTKRFVDDTSTKEMDELNPSTFDSYDYENKHNRLVPNSPCPVLYGIRGDDKKELKSAKSLIKSEKVDSWLIFETNQGTDDHLQKKSIDNIQPYQSVITEGTVCKNPYTIKGGHVIFTLKDPTGEIDCAAYEPTKHFREIIRELSVGDKVEVYGGVREKPLTVNLEKINIKHLEKQVEKVENPVCPKCGKHMKSKGIGQGYKCKKCGIKSDKPSVREKQRTIKTGLYEVPVCARRHISKPLKRLEP